MHASFQPTLFSFLPVNVCLLSSLFQVPLVFLHNFVRVLASQNFLIDTVLLIPHLSSYLSFINFSTDSTFSFPPIPSFIIPSYLVTPNNTLSCLTSAMLSLLMSCIDSTHESHPVGLYLRFIDFHFVTSILFSTQPPRVLHNILSFSTLSFN